MNRHLQRAQMLAEQSRFEMALEEIAQHLTEEPEDAQAHSLRGFCLAELEKYEEAAIAARTAIQLAPDSSHPYYIYSLVLTARNNLAEADKAIANAIELDPYDEDYFAQAAAIKLQQKQWEPALVAAEEGLKLDPEHETCTNLRAIALVKLGRKSEAGEALQSSLEREPENPLSHANMGWSKLEQGQPKQAMTHFREALRLEPEMEWARQGIVQAMKSHYFIYRMLLGFFLWINKLDGRQKWMILLGGYFGHRFLSSLARTTPELAPFLMPLIIAYIGFAILTWVGGPIFNFLLWLNPFGRLALSDEEKRTSIWVGSSIVLALVFVAAYFFSGNVDCLRSSLCLAFMTPALATFYASDKGWPRAVHHLLLLTMVFLAINVVGGTLGSMLLDESWRTGLKTVASLSSLPLLLLGFASQFGIHFLTSASPQKDSGSEKIVWWIGGSILAVVALLLTATNILAVVYGPTADALTSFPSLRIEVVENADQRWRHADEVARYSNELEAANFQRVGDFLIPEMPGTLSRFFLDLDKKIAIDVTEKSSEADLAVGVAAMTEDGQRFSISNFDTDTVYPPDWQHQVVDKPILEMYSQLKSLTQDYSLVAFDRDSLITETQNAHADAIDFLLGRGGFTESEVRKFVADKGRKISDDTINAFRDRWIRNAGKRVDQLVISNFLKSHPEHLQNVDKLICVHRLSKSVASDNDLISLETLDDHEDSINLPATWKRIGHTDTPIATRIYLDTSR